MTELARDRLFPFTPETFCSSVCLFLFAYLFLFKQSGFSLKLRSCWVSWPQQSEENLLRSTFFSLSVKAKVQSTQTIPSPEEWEGTEASRKTQSAWTVRASSPHHSALLSSWPISPGFLTSRSARRQRSVHLRAEGWGRPWGMPRHRT